MVLLNRVSLSQRVLFIDTYRYFHHRMRTMARSILVTETFIKATTARIDSSDDGAALTLMSTDMERIKMGLRTLHETWASMIQAAVAGWMLYQRIGVVFVAPMGLVIVCFGGIGILISLTGDSQRAWMAGVQKRVGLTATVISSMKNLKISGLSAAVGDYVQNLRIEELAAGARFRRIAIIAALFAFIPQLISPPLAFAFAQTTLDASRMFTSLSFITLLTQPLSQIFQSVPELVSGVACLGRIQAFLERENREDFRNVLADVRRDSEKVQMEPKTSPDVALEPVHPIAIEKGNFGWQTEKFVLRDVNIQIAASSLTIVIGPVGSGKSTLCKALLGEIPFSEGSVTLNTRYPHVGFCEQTAFLSNGSIKDNIVGFSPLNSEAYNEVVKATALDFDFATLSQGDQTNIGSDGIALSGGQKQRVSLARALYLQTDLLVLDDVFSGLDADTEEKVFRQVFGPNGLLRRRRSTVVLCTHSIRHLPEADHIVALGDGTVVEQGSFEKLMSRQGYVQRLGLKGSADSDASSEKTVSRGTTVQDPQPAPRPSITANPSSLAQNAEASRQTGDKSVYKHYFKSMGLVLAACSLFFSVLWGFFTNFPTICESASLPQRGYNRTNISARKSELFVAPRMRELTCFLAGLTYWTDDTSLAHPVHSNAYYAGIYFLLQVCGLISLLLLGIALFIVSVKRAGANLHQNALRTLMQAPLSFFTKTDTGVVTNLFSQDLNLIDTELPDATLNTLFCVSFMLLSADRDLPDTSLFRGLTGYL